MAMRAERGVGDSPTGDAISNKIIRDAVRDIQTEKVNYLTRADEARRAIALGRGQLALTEQQYGEETAARAQQLSIARIMSKRKAKYSLLAGRIGAVESLVSTAGSVASIYKKKSI